MAVLDLDLLSERESGRVEWKRGVADVNDVVKALVAFANDFQGLGGGYVVCGADETTDEHGFAAMQPTGLEPRRLKEVRASVLARCRDYVSPPLVPLVEELEAATPDRRLLVFVQPRTEHAHVFREGNTSGDYFIRDDMSTRVAKNGLLLQLLERKHALPAWDTRPNPEATIQDIDHLALKDALIRMGAWDPASRVEAALDPDATLSPMTSPLCFREPLTGVIRPRNFALLLFGRAPQRLIPSSMVVFSVYPGQDRSSDVAERLEIAGTAIHQAEVLVDRLNLQAMELMDKTDLQSPNLHKYPQRALKEAVVNALVHRNYEVRDHVRVTVFSDRVEIRSPGSLPSSLRLERFQSRNPGAHWRNPSLAWFFRGLQFAQAEGQGVPTIFRTMRDEGCPEPVFEVDPEHVLCTLPAHPRFALWEELRSIERLAVTGRPDEARARLNRLLAQDPFNAKAVELYCDVARLLRDPWPILAFVRERAQDLARFNQPALLALVEALQDLPRDKEVSTLTTLLLEEAARRRSGIIDLRRLVVGLLKERKTRRALDVLDEAEQEQPAWRTHPNVLQLRGRALAHLAREASMTARGQNVSPRLRRRAREESHDLAQSATRVLEEALLHGPDPVIRQLILDDLVEVRRAGGEVSTGKVRRDERG